MFADRRTGLLIAVAAMGYFVDIYDLVLFNVVKRESLEFILGVGDPRITDAVCFGNFGAIKKVGSLCCSEVSVSTPLRIS